jgi:hypothetical protein
MIKHERLYTLLLAIFAVSILCSNAVLTAYMALPVQARPVSRLPDWVHFVSAFLGGFYFCAVVGTLLLRLADPTIGRRLTRILNITLLFALPFGTALGLYGLWKANGTPAESAA